MKIEWEYRYVPQGQLTPDEHGRWRIDGQIWVNAEKTFPDYPTYVQHAKDINNDGYIPITICTIYQKGCFPENVPSTDPKNKFCCPCLSFWEAANIGMGKHYYYGSTVEEVQKKVEDEFNRVQSVFTNCK